MRTDIVIMAGGVGSRLYPLSTPEHPKQFIDLLGVGKTMIQLTAQRCLSAVPDAGIWVVTSASYVHFVKEQLPFVPDDQILSEPVARNTAPCIAYACRKIGKKYPDSNILVTPADAYVPDCSAFAATVREALDFTAVSSAIVCIGIKPDAPCTQYGYIQGSGTIVNGQSIVKVERFKEKPDIETAKKYLELGGFYWNAGIFVWNVSTVQNELRLHAPQIAERMDELEPSMYTDAESEALERIFPQCDKISIDYAVMEKSANVYMVPGNWEWSDLGSFESIEKITGKKLH
ncbi:MAG: mannose-1-phosphate guanylyltransferase [Bacteroidales bacterium]|nr:mannose-1-phosphate guanylyltransferase [Bacteroidales bacterium]